MSVVKVGGGWAFARAPGNDDKRPILVARCYGHEPESIDGVLLGYVEQFAYVEAWALTPEGEIDSGICTEEPEQFWHWASGYARGRSTKASKRKGRAVLLILVDANRELAMLGKPDHYQWRAGKSGPCGHTTDRLALNRPPDAPGMFLGKLEGTEWHGSFDVRQLGNWHAEGNYSEALSIDSAVTWVQSYRRMLTEHGLGPKLEGTLASQAKRSFRRHLAEHRIDGIRAHRNAELHAFEHGVMAHQSPLRFHRAGFYGVLYHLDFTAHYVSIMATERLPREAVNYWPEGCPVEQIEGTIRAGKCVLARVRMENGEHWITTPDFDAERTIEVMQAASYAAGERSGLASWAQRIFEVRQRVSATDPTLARSVKGIGNGLWGALAQRNWHCEPQDQRPAHLAQFEGPVSCKVDNYGRAWCIDAEGTYYERKPQALARDRYFALGAHMIAHGRAKTEQLAEQVELVYAHTDSVWSLDPVVGTTAFPHGNQIGGLGVERVRNVEFGEDGSRIIDGVLDAAAGGAPKRDGRFYDDFENDEGRRAYLSPGTHGALFRRLTG